MRRLLRTLVFALMAAGRPWTGHAAPAVIELPAASMTSAGIFDSRGRLVRTLWSAQWHSKGTLNVNWDGLDDDGRGVDAEERYVVRVLSHHVSYEWEGVIGNSSEDQVGAHTFRSFLPIHDMAFDAAGDGYYVVGYNERQPGLHRIRSSDIRRQDPLAHDDFRRIFRYVATDGRLVYFANVGELAQRPGDSHDPETFVVALNVTDGSEHIFPAGKQVGPAPESVWHSAIDFGLEDTAAPGPLRLAATGLAVQRNADHLFVAHAGTDEIRVLDKRTGAAFGRIAVRGAGAMAVAPDDSLWVLCRTADRETVRHYRQHDAAWEPAGEIEAPFVNPVAIGVSPLDGTVVVADAGTEQLEAFDAAGRKAWSLGRVGGYHAGGPEVSPDRFGLSAGPTYIAFQADGSFWVGDPLNDRNLHFSAQRRYLEQIMYLPHARVMAVDGSNPVRVFSGFLEFEVDYAKALGRSWQLVRNWSTGLDARYRGDFEGLQTVLTLPGGHTLGVVRRVDLNRNEIVELTAGGIRSAAATIDYNTKLYPDGSLRFHLIRGTHLEVYERRFTGFDTDGHPHWGTPTVLASVPQLDAKDPYYHAVPFIPGINEATYPETASGVVISLNPGKAVGFHLGGINPKLPGWLWRASPSGPWDLDGSGNVAPRDGRYDIGNGVQYPANIATVTGDQVVFGYHGEAWRGGEANQWLHFYDNGLFVGQFGTPGMQRDIGQRTSAVAGVAGNAFSPQLVTVNGRIYLWHNDENGHGGIHRWRLDGANAIRILESPIRP